MTDLNKIFVRVPSTATSFDGATVSATSTKIYFVEATNTIWAKGKQYGASASDLARITALETAVGNKDNTGLVKDVADLKTTVGSSTSGLVKDTADNAAAITALQTLLGASEKGESEATFAARISALETLVGGEEADADAVINKLKEVYAWFNEVAETETGKSLISSVSANTAAVATLTGDGAGSVAEAKAAADAAQTDATAALNAIGTAKDGENAGTGLTGRIESLEASRTSDAVTVSATDGVTKGGVTYKYVHHTQTEATAAFVKVGNDSEGHVVLGAAVAKSDITGLLDAGDGTYDTKGAAADVQGSTTETVESVNTKVTALETWTGDLWEDYA